MLKSSASSSSQPPAKKPRGSVGNPIENATRSKELSLPKLSDREAVLAATAVKPKPPSKLATPKPPSEPPTNEQLAKAMVGDAEDEFIYFFCHDTFKFNDSGMKSRSLEFEHKEIIIQILNV